MEKNSGIVYCADVVALYKGSIVIVERLGSVKGWALPGGKQNPGEMLTETAKREFKEETGLDLVIKETLFTRAEVDRDPRGRYVSTVFWGRAHGKSRDEPGKTKVIFLRPAELAELIKSKDRFIFDHASILEESLGMLGLI